MIILGSDQENKLLAKGGNYMELSIQIKKYRTELHLSQEELAEKVYVTRQTISNWENEKSYPDIHSLLLSSPYNPVHMLRWLYPAHRINNYPADHL